MTFKQIARVIFAPRRGSGEWLSQRLSTALLATLYKRDWSAL